MEPNSLRIALGFQRTTCDCKACTFNCHFMPGYLVPDDLEALYKTTSQPGQTLEDWARENLLASPGATVLAADRIVRIPTLVPARRPDSSCIHLKEERCSVHSVSPFGCAFIDAHMTKAEADARSSAGLKAIILAYVHEQPYSKIWQMLWDANLRAPGPAESREKMQKAWEKQQQEQACPSSPSAPAAGVESS